MKRVIVVLVAVLIVGLAFVPFLLPSDEMTSYSAYNSSSDGLSILRNEAELIGDVHTIITSPTIIAEEEEPSKSLYIAVGVQKEYSSIEIDVLVEYVRTGGRVLIADDTGYASDLATALADESSDGTSLGFTRRIVYSSEDSRPLETTTFKLSNVRYDLPLSNPTALFCQGKDVEHLASSSTSDFTDWDGDGNGEIGEVGIVPLAASFLLEGGRGILFGDPDILSNEVLGADESGNLTSDILAWLLPDGGNVYFDESRHDVKDISTFDRYILGVILATSRGAISYLMITVTAVATAIILVSRKDPEPWEHVFDLSGYKGATTEFGKRKRLRKALQQELRFRMEEATGLMQEELVKMGDPMIMGILGSELLLKVFKGRNLSPQEIKKAVDEIRRWKHDR